MPRLITHDCQLRRSRAPFERFLAEATGLGRHRGPLLVQLPPSLAFEARAAARFFEMVRERVRGACGLRAPASDVVQRSCGCVDEPLRRSQGGRESGYHRGVERSRGLERHRVLSPAWRSANVLVGYEANHLSRLATLVRQISESVDVWCVFDNTASGAAMENAWELRQLFR